MKRTLLSGTLLLLLCCFSTAAEAQIISAGSDNKWNPDPVAVTVAAPGIATQVLSTSLFQPPRQPASSIFKKHLGSANPVLWGKSLRSTANSEKFLSSPQWQAAKKDIFRNYGKSLKVRQYVEYQEYLFRKAIKLNNKANFRSVDVKGNLAESIMDDFYRKDGWEVMDGKRGRNGFDGLYVKRTPLGKIRDYLVADAKSGKSRLQQTARGKQLSPEWIKGNLEDLIQSAHEEYKKKPSAVTKQRIIDLEQIMKLKGRTARVMSMKLISRNGNPCFQIKFIGPDGNVLREPKPIDMGPGGNVSQQKLIYKNFEKHLAVYDKVRASELVQKLENNIKQGKIKTDSDIYSFIKRNIPDKKLARAVTEELGERPPRGFLAKARGLRIAQAGGIIANAASVTGLIIAGDILHGQFDRNTLIKASLFAGGAAAAAVTMHYGTEYLSKKLAEKILQQEGKKVSQKVINQLARTMTKSMGSAFVIGTEIYALWSYSRAYQTGNLSQEDFLVYSGLTTLGAAGSLAAILAGSSSVLGPVGFIIGATTAAAILWYSHYQETKKQERLEKEELFRAKWEITNDEEKFRKAIEKMEKEAETQRRNAWKKLLTASIP